MTSFVFRRQLIIEWSHCDPAGIVFNPRFFEFFDTSTWLLFGAAVGVTVEQIASTFDIVGVPLVDVRAEFHRPARFGDTIEIASHVSEFRRSSLDVTHRTTVGGDLAVEAVETRVWAERDKSDPEKLKAVPIPTAVIAKFG